MSPDHTKASKPRASALQEFNLPIRKRAASASPERDAARGVAKQPKMGPDADNHPDSPPAATDAESWPIRPTYSELQEELRLAIQHAHVAEDRAIKAENENRGLRIQRRQAEKDKNECLIALNRERADAASQKRSLMEVENAAHVLMSKLGFVTQGKKSQIHETLEQIDGLQLDSAVSGIQHQETHQSANTDVPSKVIPCMQCFSKGWNCDTETPCQNCALRNKPRCMRVKCKRYAKGTCNNQYINCGFAHEDDGYENVIAYRKLKRTDIGKTAPVDQLKEKTANKVKLGEGGDDGDLPLLVGGEKENIKASSGIEEGEIGTDVDME